MQTPVRFSSCRGVAFEVKPHSDPFAVISAPTPSNSKPFWPFGTSRVFPSSIQRSSSKASSHFCDLDLHEDEEDALQSILEENYDVEKQNPLASLSVQNASKPHHQPTKPVKKNESRLSVILLDQGLFTVYKRLFVICLTLNVTGLVLAATAHFPYGRNKAALFSIGNILALTLCRSEAFLRVVFWLAVKTIGNSWVPLFLKTATTSFLQSIGGIHSGCGVSSIAWLVYALVLTLKDRHNTSPEIIGVSSAILGLLCLSCLLWAFIMLTISYDPKTKSYSNKLGSSLVKSQEFWLTVTITILIIMPWLTVRRVAVKVSTASGHASIIKFEGGIKAGILGRISPSPLSEWHAFGIISDGKKEHMMLAGAVGDFTKSLVSNPPTHLWVRQVHFAGLPYLVNMYERVLLVATGSGICVFLSFLLQPCKEIKEIVSGYPKEKVIIHDTALLGRPNVSELSVNAAKNWGAQVMIVTSNPEGSRDVVNACKAAGIAAFGPIWDS
ncbi:adenylate-forming reductase 03009-like [Abrus precatorius]|uniref:Adenylate-forming reductase 03009-like n=1 Tax=Abrus precatorius TaxID=3816 RepID=A0A8B8K4Y3_ABRPR|nr:adenylate-forming reductase 03009-like [Abrus precatorius]